LSVSKFERVCPVTDLFSSSGLTQTSLL